MRITAGPVAVPVLAALFGFVSAVGGILLALAGTLPVSPYITTLSFSIYVICWIVQRVRGGVRPAVSHSPFQIRNRAARLLRRALLRRH